VIAALRAGEQLTLTANRAPLADIVPHLPRNPWIQAFALVQIVEGPGAEATLEEEIARMVKGMLEKTLDSW
jgi:antitoxin (DNA-binding transcriptional repressor) of toxin-antitoxin stability system